MSDEILLQKAIKTMKEAGLEITMENLVDVIQRVKDKETRPLHYLNSPRVWYYFKLGPFETIVSYTKAANEHDAWRYAYSHFCEWYLIEPPQAHEMPSFLVTKQLNHEQFNQWCAKMWPSTYGQKEESNNGNQPKLQEKA